MHSRFRTKGVLLAALLALVASMALPHSASAEPEPGARKKGFRLFARALGAMTINRVYCGLATTGEVCVDSTNSSTIGGGFWPKGTPDQYIFNSGLQVAGIVGPDGGTWAGDTVGGFFFDPKGTTQHGEEVEPIYNATNKADLDIWPEAACVPHNPGNPGDEAPTLFDPLLQTDPTNTSTNYSYPCRKSASQGDIWFMSWEGNPALRAGRKHPIGVVVETRGMGWNFPSGNEDILYFIYTFYNVTSLNAADYANVRPSMRPILLQKAQDLHAAVAATGVTLPTNGYTMTNLFAAFARDDDVGSAGANYSSVNLPFALGYTYDHGFSPNLPGWKFDASIFSAPFFPGVGFTGAKYLKSPTGPGAIQLFSNTINGAPFAGAVNDPRDVVQLYRYLSGTLSPATGDQSCNTGIQAQTRICFINNTSSQDMRFFQSSTPLTLPPGGSGSIVVAYIFAAPVRTAGAINNTDVKPGDPRRLTNAAQLVTGANLIDSLTGFRGFTDANSNGVVEQSEISVVPRSLLGKSLTAQTVFDFKFLLPFAPDAPDFFLIPGDNQVTVLWKPTASEASGDPFADIAGQATVGGSPNVLYDPNYRKFDVEGYRIYRGRVDAPNELALIAQFDYAGTVIRDFTGIVNPVPSCAPEFAITTGCPTLAANQKNGTVLTNHVDYDLVGDVIQLNAGTGRVPLQSGLAQILKADTSTTGGGTNGLCGPRTACPALANTGVPFSFIDRGVRNNFRYFYAVTAFDVNSIESGPASLESPRGTKSVRPVKPASNFLNTSQITTFVVGRGVAMDTIITQDPTIDPVKGTFSGPSRPANGAVVGFVGELAKQVLAAPGAFSVTLDSIAGGEDDFSCCGGMGTPSPTTYFFTAQSGSLVTKLTLPVQRDGGDAGAVAGNQAFFAAVSVDNNLAKSYGGDGSFQLQGALSDTVSNAMLGSAQALGCRIKGGPITGGTNDCIYSGPRWFNSPTTGTSSPLPSARLGTETFADPTGGNCRHNGGNNPVCTAVNFNNGGSLTGVSTIHVPQSYTQLIRRWRNVEAVTASYWRAADMNVYWGANGRIDSVIDVTHNVPIPDAYIRNGAGAVTGLRKLGANWGILNPGKTNVASTSSGGIL